MFDRENPRGSSAATKGLCLVTRPMKRMFWMPALITYAHRLMERQRKGVKVKNWRLRPDAKSQAHV